MSLKRRNARTVECSPPIDLDSPPSTCADLTIWFNELTLALHHGVAQWPECPRVKSLQTILNAWGRVRTPAGNVENVLKARRIREQIDYDVSTPEPPDDPMVLPLWHAIGLGRMAHDVATAETIDSAAARSIAASVRIAVAGVATRETAETDAFKRHHGIKDAQEEVRKSEDEVTPGPIERRAAASLLDFVQYMNPKYQVAFHHRIIADALEKVARGEIKRLMINMPPRHGKSELASLNFPAWYLGQFPDRQIITVTYAQELASSIGRNVRNLISEPAYQRVFPGTQLSEDSKARNKFHTQRKGVYFAVGIGGPATGLGADVLLVDDPIKNREEAQSETIRSRNKDWYTAVANTRLMPGGAVILISTRWHSDDLSGWLLKEHADEGWTVVSLPALAEEKEFWRIGPLTWTREIGDALWPEWYDKDALAAKRRMSSRDWNALFQQRPVEIGGNMCKLDWFGRYSARPKCGKITLSIDAGQKGGANNDPTVVLVIGENADGHVVLDMWRDRAIYPRLVPKIVEMIRQWWPTAVLIEDKASGINLLQDLGCTELANRIPMIGINPDGDKVTRFDRVTPIIEKGKVILPAPDTACEWLATFEDEVTSFPLGKHDDIVDALSQYLNWVRKEGMAFASSGQESFSDPAMTALLGRISGPWSKGGALAGAVGNGTLVFRRR